MVIGLLACASDPAETAPVAAPEAVLGEDAVVFVGEAESFDAGDSVGARFTWDFGDGTVAEGARVSHAWAEPGRYTVRLTATAADGRTDTAATGRTAVYAPLDPAPTTSGRLALLDGVLYAALPDADQVVVVEGGAVVDRLSTCGHPVAVSAAAGTLAVACRDDAVQLWATADRALVADIPLRWGARPTAVAADPAGDAAWAALGGTGELVRVDRAGATVVATLPDPGSVVAGEDAVWVSRFRSAPGGGEARYLAGEETLFTFAPDPGPDSDTDARGVPTLLGASALRPDGRAYVVAGTKANLERGLVRDGLPLTHETTSRAALRLVDATTGEPLARAMFDNRDRVGAVAFTPLGDRLLVAHLGAGVVDVLDPFTLTRLGGFQEVGVGLDGLATDGETAWVLASWDRELVAYDLGAGNAEVELARIPLVEVEPLDPEALLGGRVFHNAGDRRMSTDAYLACASCHPDGAADQLTWDFTDRGEGLRDTQPLWAMPVDGPFHWTANFDEIQDFENAIRAFQAGEGFMDDADYAATEDPLGAPKAGRSSELDALAAYVRTFAADPPRSPWRDEDGGWTEAAQRGREVFATAGCGDCHAGEATTDAGWNEDGSPVLHDVGTLLDTSGSRSGGPLTGLRTPRLVGLFASAPYLHDGRAATLEEALLAHGQNPDPDLVRYLLELEHTP